MGKCSLSFDSNMAIDFCIPIKKHFKKFPSAFGGHLIYIYIHPRKEKGSIEIILGFSFWIHFSVW
jgi:hypothetical protein